MEAFPTPNRPSNWFFSSFFSVGFFTSSLVFVVGAGKGGGVGFGIGAAGAAWARVVTDAKLAVRKLVRRETDLLVMY